MDRRSSAGDADRMSRAEAFGELVLQSLEHGAVRQRTGAENLLNETFFFVTEVSRSEGN